MPIRAVANESPDLYERGSIWVGESNFGVRKRMKSTIAILTFCAAFFPCIVEAQFVRLADHESSFGGVARSTLSTNVQAPPEDLLFAEAVAYDSTDNLAFDSAESNLCGCDHACRQGVHCGNQLFGDWQGARSGLAGHGIIADLEFTQFYQGVASGGSQQSDAYGGKLDYMFTFLGEPLGLNKGFTAILHAESRYGESLGGEAGAFALPNTNMLWPLPDEDDTAITGLLLMQALNERVALFGGKINVADFWTMMYPNVGRGVDGFMNLNTLAAGMPWLRFVNLSINGAGTLVMKGEQIQGGFVVFDTNNSSTTLGLNNLFDQGAGMLGLWRFFTDWNGKPGSHLFAGGYSSRAYTSLDRTSWTFLPGQGGGLAPGIETGAWAFAYYFDQVFWADPCNDKRKLQLFTGGGLSDGNPSFSRWNWFASVEGFGLIPGRDQDRMGVGYFYNGLSSDFKQLVGTLPAVDLQDVHGGEVYYNAAITPWFHLTADLQVVDNENSAEDTAIILGLRGKIDL